MPIVIVNVREGRTVEQKRRMAEKVTDAICETMDVKRAAVRIIVNEMKDENFARGGVLVCDDPAMPQVKPKA